LVKPVGFGGKAAWSKGTIAGNLFSCFSHISSQQSSLSSSMDGLAMK
jgi:hypothetical protein